MASTAAFVLLLAISQCLLAIEIKDLPGAPKVNFKQYSGYFTVGEKKNHQMHYWFMESQNDPANDPVILWLTGGPGCSGIGALLTEWGPFMINSDGATLRKNNYSWNTNASVLTLESPAGVGYSYSTDGNTKTGDFQTANENWEALVAFFTEFKQFKKNDFYVTGESYAGVYVPMLMTTILEKQKQFQMNLKGFAIGNGCVSVNDGADALVNFLHGHGMIDDNNYENAKKKCCQNDIDECPFHKFNDKDECGQFVDDAFRMAWEGGVNPYNIYSDCLGSSGQEISSRYRMDYKLHMGRELNLTELSTAPTCMSDTDVTKYLNRPDVREALGIPKELGQWALCTDNVKYQKEEPEMLSRVQNGLKKGLKGLMYSGDTDLVCTFLMGQRFSRKLGIKEVKTKSTYMVDGQVGGFHTEYENYHFVTVRGAGHLVPTDKPAVSLHILNAFMFNKKF